MHTIIKKGSIVGLSAAIIGAIGIMFQSNDKLTKNANDIIKLVKSKIEQESKYSNYVNELILAQAILESNLVNSPSKLAMNDGNLFGIKCSNKVKTCTSYPTIEYIKGKKVVVTALFAHFNSISDCIRFRLEMFKMVRYQNVTNCVSFSDCAIRIQKSGYATDPSYSKQLIGVYNQFIKMR